MASKLKFEPEDDDLNQIAEGDKYIYRIRRISDDNWCLTVTFIRPETQEEETEPYLTGYFTTERMSKLVANEFNKPFVHVPGADRWRDAKRSASEKLALTFEKFHLGEFDVHIALRENAAYIISRVSDGEVLLRRVSASGSMMADTLPTVAAAKAVARAAAFANCTTWGHYQGIRNRILRKFNAKDIEHAREGNRNRARNAMLAELDQIRDGLEEWQNTVERNINNWNGSGPFPDTQAGNIIGQINATTRYLSACDGGKG